MLLRSHNYKDVKDKLEAFLKERMVWQNGKMIRIGNIYRWIDDGKIQYFECIKRGNKPIFAAHEDKANNIYYFWRNTPDTVSVVKYSKENKFQYEVQVPKTGWYQGCQAIGVDLIWCSRREIVHLFTPITKQEIFF